MSSDVDSRLAKLTLAVKWMSPVLALALVLNTIAASVELDGDRLSVDRAYLAAAIGTGLGLAAAGVLLVWVRRARGQGMAKLGLSALASGLAAAGLLLAAIAVVLASTAEVADHPWTRAGVYSGVWLLVLLVLAMLAVDESRGN